MNSLPSAFESRMKNLLGECASAFFQALQSPAPVSIRLNPAKTGAAALSVSNSETAPIPWCSSGRYLKERPVFTLDPCFHGGAYYVQEASSMFLEHVLEQIMPESPIKMLDLCAAPGGKSTLAASLLPKDSLLVVNEVIRSRVSILRENIIKWGHDNIVVTNNDPADFSQLKGAFDIVLADAPCSGEGMFRKDAKAIEEWSENNLRICSERQKRILSDIWDTIKPGGYLIYSTCTYNPGENEDIAEWLTTHFDAQSIKIEHSFNDIIRSDSSIYGYRFYPHKIVGEGFFITLLQKKDGEEFQFKRKKKQDKFKPILLPEEITGLLNNPAKFSGYYKEDIAGIIPEIHEEFINYIENFLKVIYKGCELAEINNRKLRLSHPLALYQGLDPSQCICNEVDLNTALRYLKKEDIPVTAKAGEWVLITYNHIGIGWGKSIGNRLNNYFPKEWRIRMDIKNI